MKYFSHPLVVLTVFALSIGVSAEVSSSEDVVAIDCGSIVAQTVSEMRVGAEAWWSDDVEKMSGMAAMTACFKAISVYQMKSDSDLGKDASDTPSVSDAGTEGDTSSSLSFRPLSGSASKKPYERARARKDPK